MLNFKGGGGGISGSRTPGIRERINYIGKTRLIDVPGKTKKVFMARHFSRKSEMPQIFIYFNTC